MGKEPKKAKSVAPQEDVAPPPDPKVIAAMQLLHKQFPDKIGWTKKIHYLWDVFYRINYYDALLQRFTESHFVSVREGIINELKDPPRAKRAFWDD